ncbi:MAG: hypothetical protein KatS3mg038_2347 [Candidatus Kapaibacterium sp.]|nr:MAG: hypothetical protein KatS3mg038_2347 [Candidatus Kapabacteria bacterium]
MRYYCWLLLCSCSLPLSSWAEPAWLDTARNYLHVRETSPNCSRDIERFLRSVGLPCGYAWCAAFVRYCLDAGRARYPTVRSAAARAYVLRTSIPVKHVVKGYRTITRGWLAIWTHSASWTGHIGIVETVRDNAIVTIEGNTSPGSGINRDGDGVYRRTRTVPLVASTRLQLRWFTPVQ